MSRRAPSLTGTRISSRFSPGSNRSRWDKGPGSALAPLAYARTVSDGVPVTGPAAVLVGRESERAQIDAFVASVPSEQSSLTIIGESGIGKTALWRYAIASSRDHGFRVLISTTGRRGDAAVRHRLDRPVRAGRSPGGIRRSRRSDRGWPRRTRGPQGYRRGATCGARHRRRSMVGLVLGTFAPIRPPPSGNHRATRRRDDASARGSAGGSSRGGLHPSCRATAHRRAGAAQPR